MATHDHTSPPPGVHLLRRLLTVLCTALAVGMAALPPAPHVGLLAGCPGPIARHA